MFGPGDRAVVNSCFSGSERKCLFDQSASAGGGTEPTWNYTFWSPDCFDKDFPFLCTNIPLERHFLSEPLRKRMNEMGSKTSYSEFRLGYCLSGAQISSSKSSSLRRRKGNKVKGQKAQPAVQQPSQKQARVAPQEKTERKSFCRKGWKMFPLRQNRSLEEELPPLPYLPQVHQRYYPITCYL